MTDQHTPWWWKLLDCIPERWLFQPIPKDIADKIKRTS